MEAIMEEIVYLNGSLIPRSQARVSVFDNGFLYGYGIFETMRAYHGIIFLLECHINRLMDSAKIIGLGTSLAGIACLVFFGILAVFVLVRLFLLV